MYYADQIINQMAVDLMPNRTLCSVLEDMRKCNETKNYSYLSGLIEEAQMLGNRMEAKLYDIKDYEYKMEELRRMKKEVKDLKAEKENLQNAATIS